MVIVITLIIIIWMREIQQDLLRNWWEVNEIAQLVSSNEEIDNNYNNSNNNRHI